MTKETKVLSLTNLVSNGLSILYSEILMGHRSGGLAIESYVRPSQKCKDRCGETIHQGITLRSNLINTITLIIMTSSFLIRLMGSRLCMWTVNDVP
jgi:hypothetical protein